MSPVEIPDTGRALGMQLGALYRTLSRTDDLKLARRFTDRARTCCTDAASRSLTAGTRFGAAFDACAFVTLARLGRRGILFDGAPEGLEVVVASAVLQYHYAGLVGAVERHLRRYETPSEPSEEEVELMLAEAQVMLREMLKGSKTIGTSAHGGVT